MPCLKGFHRRASSVGLVVGVGAALVLAYFSFDRPLRETYNWLLVAIIIVSLAVPLSELYCRSDRSFRQQVLKALHDQEIKVFYQPIVRLADERIIGAEALLRWPGSPFSTEFLIAKAEQMGWIQTITDYVIKRAIQDWHTFREIHPEFCININISAPELVSDSFVERLITIIHSLSVGAIALEITERQSAPLDKISGAISRLRDAGFKVYMDDFGTGYSSMTALLDLPLDGFKLDVAFIKSPYGLSAIRAINTFASEMGRNVVVEGVETTKHKQSLMQINADMIVQGWLFGRAMQEKELLAQMKSSREKSV